VISTNTVDNRTADEDKHEWVARSNRLMPNKEDARHLAISATNKTIFQLNDNFSNGNNEKLKKSMRNCDVEISSEIILDFIFINFRLQKMHILFMEIDIHPHLA